MLCKGPNANATTVQARQMTLYGIEKSGVANEMISVSVVNLTTYPLSLAFMLK